MKEKKKEACLQWHPAFFVGMQIELKEEAGNLIFENEYQLGTKPLGIDIRYQCTNSKKYREDIPQI